MTRDTDNDRTLGPEMQAEGWRAIGDTIHWVHVPSNRSVNVDDYTWGQCSGIPAVPEAPNDPETPGWVVTCHVHDELGNPEESSAYWVPSWSAALRGARALRASILAEHPPMVHAEQLTFADMLPEGSL
ncbi:MAG: hypothetical protein KF894_34110 [Labilithrix sp.]|nr:hypothetical protein [Labilithrix sp.]